MSASQAVSWHFASTSTQLSTFGYLKECPPDKAGRKKDFFLAVERLEFVLAVCSSTFKHVIEFLGAECPVEEPPFDFLTWFDLCDHLRSLLNSAERLRHGERLPSRQDSFTNLGSQDERLLCSRMVDIPPEQNWMSASEFPRYDLQVNTKYLTEVLPEFVSYFEENQNTAEGHWDDNYLEPSYDFFEEMGVETTTNRQNWMLRQKAARNRWVLNNVQTFGAFFSRNV